MTLRGKVFGAIRWAAVATIVRAILQFGQIVLLARFLQKEDMGLAVLVFSYIAFVQVFTDFGLSNIILHRSDLEKEDLGAIFGFGLVLGGLLWFLSCSASVFLASFYADERLVPIFCIAGSILFFNSIWMQHKTVAEKMYRFGNVAKAEIFSGILAFSLMVAALYFYGGVYCAIVFPVSYSFLMAFLVPIFCGSSFFWSFRFSSLRPYLSYSAYNLGFSITNSLTSQADIFFGSRLIGRSEMGGYGVSKDLGQKIALVVNNTVARVASPLIADYRNESNELRRVYEKILSLTTFVNFPIYMAMTIFSKNYVALFFGERWGDSFLIFAVLGLWGLFRSVGNPCGSLLFVLGKTKLAFRFSLVSALVFVPCFYIGANFGALGLACSMLLTMFGQQIFPIWRYIVGPLAGISYLSYLNCIFRPLLASVFSFLIPYGLLCFEYLGFIASQVVALILYLALSYFFNRDSLLEAVRFLGLSKLVSKL